MFLNGANVWLFTATKVNMYTRQSSYIKPLHYGVTLQKLVLSRWTLASSLTRYRHKWAAAADDADGHLRNRLFIIIRRIVLSYRKDPNSNEITNCFRVGSGMAWSCFCCLLWKVPVWRLITCSKPQSEILWSTDMNLFKFQSTRFVFYWCHLQDNFLMR